MKIARAFFIFVKQRSTNIFLTSLLAYLQHKSSASSFVAEFLLIFFFGFSLILVAIAGLFHSLSE